MTVEELMHANLMQVFGERDPRRRLEVIARTYAPDVVFADPEESVVGQRALNDKAQRLLDESPAFVFSPGGEVQVVQDLGYLAWQFGPEGEPPVVRGADVALVADGVITKVWTMLTPS
jgi:hypothetical protein